MKVYLVEYDFEIIKMKSFKSDYEHRIRQFTDSSELIKTVKDLQSKYYISNIKVYAGEVKEIDIEKVLNPF